MAEAPSAVSGTRRHFEKTLLTTSMSSSVNLLNGKIFSITTLLLTTTTNQPLLIFQTYFIFKAGNKY